MVIATDATTTTTAAGGGFESVDGATVDAKKLQKTHLVGSICACRNHGYVENQPTDQRLRFGD